MNTQKAKEFIYRNARPLDLARWNFLFEHGDKESVLNILRTYQNEDGGFGHGLEPDAWNPNSSPVQTWVATEIIREIGIEDSSNPIIQGILTYLSSETDFDGHTWMNTVSSNNDFPHAPWWTYDSTQEQSYNPTASMIGFIIKYANHESELYQRAVTLAKEAYTFLKANFPLDAMHTVACFVELYEYLKESNTYDILDLQEFEDLLKKQIKYVLTEDTSVWAVQYVCKPSLFIGSKDSDFYESNSKLCEFECEFISETQNEDGTWNITWSWDEYPEEWQISKNWWKSDWIIKNMKFYNAMKK